MHQGAAFIKRICDTKNDELLITLKQNAQNHQGYFIPAGIVQHVIANGFISLALVLTTIADGFELMESLSEAVL